MNAIMDSAHTVQLDPITIGLEKYGLPDLRKMRNLQRMAHIKAVVQKQPKRHPPNNDNDPSSSVVMMDSPIKLRRLSRHFSRSARLFAIYMGKAMEESSSI
jgi:hypothetical protein